MKTEEIVSAAMATVVAVDEESDDEFEFSLVMDAIEPYPADEIFEDGKIRTTYPLFDRSLLETDAATKEAIERDLRLPFRKLAIQESELARSGSASSSSSIGDLDEIPAGGPRSVPATPDLWKKSSSTGSSSSRKWRLRDLIGGRSHSDGKEKFLFLAPPEKKMATAEIAKQAKVVEVGKSKEKGKGKKKTEVNMATLHRLYYDKSAGGSPSRRPSQSNKQGFVGILGLGRTF